MNSLGKAFICFWLVGILLTFVSFLATAVTTTVWEQNSQKDFNSGKPKNLSITSNNEVMLTRELIKLEGNMSETRVWCLARDSKGNIFAGTGDKGKIFKISNEGEISLVFDSPETDIFSLLIDKDDNIYAGTSPDGLIYRIKSGQVPETFFNSGEKYIWSMVFDNSGNIYAGTGINGKLYKVSPEGKGEVIYDSNDIHIKSLLSMGDTIYAGTEGSGIILKISPDSKPFVIYDTSEKEISCLAMDEKGNLYAGAASGEVSPGRDDAGRSGPPTLSSERERSEQKSVIYQITSDGVVSQIWRSPDPLIFSMIVDDGRLIVGTGDAGKVYSVTPDKDWALIADCEESQVLCIYKSSHKGETWLATGNPGKLYKLSTGYLKEGTLESSVKDTSVTSSWGVISWDAVTPEDTKISLSTRSGNTEKPDDTWSKWSDDYSNSSGVPVANPSARFIQWRVRLNSEGTATPVLKKVSLAYLQRNVKPAFRSLTIGAEQERGEGPQGPPVPVRRPSSNPDDESQSESEKLPLSGKKVIKWQASDPNGDTLEYSVFFRGAEEQNWKLLKEELKGTSYPIDTESFPDGKYFFKILASDLPSNPKDIALSNEKISDLYEIDNTPPRVFDLQSVASANGIYVISGKVEDAGSYIKSLSYSIDGGDWKMAFPSDQVLDSKLEVFAFTTGALTAGEHTVAVKANDAAGNSGIAKTVFVIK